MTIESAEPQRIRVHIYHSALSMALNLTWQVRREDPPELVPPHAICWLDKGIKNSPAHITVRPGLIDGASARFLLQSNALTAGEARDLALFFQDEHSNWITSSAAADLALVTITRDPPAQDERPSLLSFAEEDGVQGGPGTRVGVHLTLTRSGAYAVHLYTLKALDLFATYYSDSSFTLPLRAAPAAEIDFSRAAEGPLVEYATHPLHPLASLAYNSSFSVRWSGFIKVHLRIYVPIYPAFVMNGYQADCCA